MKDDDGFGPVSGGTQITVNAARIRVVVCAGEGSDVRCAALDIVHDASPDAAPALTVSVPPNDDDANALTLRVLRRRPRSLAHATTRRGPIGTRRRPRRASDCFRIGRYGKCLGRDSIERRRVRADLGVRGIGRFRHGCVPRGSAKGGRRGQHFVAVRERGRRACGYDQVGGDGRRVRRDWRIRAPHRARRVAGGGGAGLRRGGGFCGFAEGYTRCRARRCPWGSRRFPWRSARRLILYLLVSRRI